MIDIAAMLRPVRAKRMNQLEELAERLADGEILPAEVIDAKLVEAGKQPADLQAMVDRKARVEALAEISKAGTPARKRLATITGEISAARADFDKVRDKLRGIEAKHSEERSQLEAAVQAADAARLKLLSKECLPPLLWTRLVEAERLADESGEEHGTALRRLPEVEAAADEAERFAARAAEGRPVRHSGELIDAEAAARLAKERRAARDAHQASVPKLETAWRKACADRDATREEILKAIGL